mgnify:CR=1 FL=1
MGVRKRIVRIWDVPAGGILPAAVHKSLCKFPVPRFLPDIPEFLIDSFLLYQFSVNAYVTGYLTAARAGEAVPPHMLSVVWSTIRWPVFAVLMGFTGLGLLGIPVLFSIRGFLLSFAITSFVRMFGGVGGVLAFLTFGVTGLVAIPVLFVLGVQSLAAARLLAGRFLGDGKRSLPFGRAYWVRCGLCSAALCLCALLEYAAVPALVRLVAPLF